MSGFKNLLKSDTPTGSQSTALGGQGSHFQSRRDDDPAFATRAADTDVVGSTVTGTEPSTAGPSDTSAAPAPVSHAYNTAGPEAGGAGHIGTTSASDSAPLPGDRTAAQTSGGPPGSTTYNFPQTLRSGDNTSSGPSARTGAGTESGSAAIGETTTYSSRPLASGDPTGSIVDHQSTDPLTYKLPEAGSHHPTATGTGNSATSTVTSPTGPTSSSAVTSSAAATAASAAWNTHNRQERMPGEFPSDGNENPYRATNLDPRVDGGKPRPPQANTSLPSHTRDSTLGSSTSGVASGLGTSHNERSVPSTAHEHSGPAPSTLTSTADPAARAAQYATSANTKVPDTTSATTTQSQPTGEQQGVMGRALDAVGLGGAANAAAGYLGYGAVAHGSTGSNEPRDTSAIATQPGVAAQESGPPKHYRRESIPTTAYPSTDAARPIPPPVGGTLDARRSIDRGVGSSNTGISNERGIGGTPATTQGVASGSGFGLGSGNSGVPRQEYSESSRLRDDVGTGGTRDSHTGRNIAAGGAAAAATGAGVHGLQHQGRSDDLRSSAAEDARRDDTLSGGHSYTIGSGGPAPVDAISSRDPNSRATGLQGTGLGSSTSSSRPIDAVAAAPGRYEGQDYNTTSRTTPSTGLGSGNESLRRDDHSHAGRDAALGASAAAAGIYAAGDHARHGTIHDAITVGTPTTTDTSTRGASTGQGGIDSRQYDVHDAHDSSSYGTSTGYGTSGATGTTGLSSHGTSAGHGTTGLTTGGTSSTGPSSYGTSSGYGTAPTHDTTTLGDRNLRQEGDHTGRNVGLGAAAGTAAGGAAYAAHDRHNERDLEKQREADAKEAAKREKQHEKEIEKQRSHAEKEEKKHHKEVEKEEKRQQKEMDKEEKEHAAAAEKREHARLAAEEEDRKRRERETAAGVAPLAQTGMVAHDPHAHEKEKKPSIFKRIFKRRKNKDTGEEEEYSSDDEEDKARHYAAAGGSSVPTHHSDDKGRTVLGHGRDKEAYKEHPAWKGPVTDTAAENSLNTPGRPHPGAEERLGYEPGSTSAGYSPSGREGGAAAISGATAAGTSSGYGTSDQRTGHLGSGTTGHTSGTDGRPHDSITGLPYDPSKDPSTAARLSEHEQGGLTGTTGSGHVLGSEPLGEITDHRR